MTGQRRYIVIYNDTYGEMEPWTDVFESREQAIEAVQADHRIRAARRDLAAPEMESYPLEDEVGSDVTVGVPQSEDPGVPRWGSYTIFRLRNTE